MKKKFILDTNVILHDSSCIHQFEEHDIFIPITVIEELDRFKKGNDIINCNARDFLRTLDAISNDKIFNGGIPIGENKGNISIIIDGELHERIQNSFAGPNADNRILNVAYQSAQKDGFKKIVLVSKDVNLRLKARSIGIKTENYQNKYVADLSEINTGIRTIENVEHSIIEDLYSAPYQIETMRLNGVNPFLANENIILKNGSLSALGTYNKKEKMVKRVEPKVSYGIKARNVEQIFALNAMLNTDIPLVTISGKAGTGKTLLALSAALEMRKKYRQIFIARPIVPLSNKDIGFLPGDIASKLDPYMQPLYDNLMVIQNQINEGKLQNNQIKEFIEKEKIIITPLSYIRGRSIVRIFFIVDEAQNLTPHEVKTIITRAGEGTKIVFTGDIYQIDHPYLDSQTNGLAYIIDRMKDQSLYAHINLHKGERSNLSEVASRIL